MNPDIPHKFTSVFYEENLKSMVNIPRPILNVMGVCRAIIPVKLFDIDCRYSVVCLSGESFKDCIGYYEVPIDDAPE